MDMHEAINGWLPIAAADESDVWVYFAKVDEPTPSREIMDLLCDSIATDLVAAAEAAGEEPRAVLAGEAFAEFGPKPGSDPVDFGGVRLFAPVKAECVLRNADCADREAFDRAQALMAGEGESVTTERTAQPTVRYVALLDQRWEREDGDEAKPCDVGIAALYEVELDAGVDFATSALSVLWFMEHGCDDGLLHAGVDWDEALSDLELASGRHQGFTFDLAGVRSVRRLVFVELDDEDIPVVDVQYRTARS